MNAAAEGSVRTMRSKFTDVEDHKLCALVEQLGVSNWAAVAACLPGRTVRQCRDRWHHYLAPDTKLSDWSPEEDRLLVDNLRIVGKQWAKLTPLFPGRTGISIRNRCCKLARRRDADPLLKSVVFDDNRKKIKTDLTDARELFHPDVGDDAPSTFPSCLSLLTTVSAAPDATKLHPLNPRVKPVGRFTTSMTAVLI